MFLIISKNVVLLQSDRDSINFTLRYFQSKNTIFRIPIFFYKKAVFENMNPIKSGKKGENFPELHRVIMNFKGLAQRFTPSGWRDLQEYLNEYTYRFNRSFMKGNIQNHY